MTISELVEKRFVGPIMIFGTYGALYVFKNVTIVSSITGTITVGLLIAALIMKHQKMGHNSTKKVTIMFLQALLLFGMTLSVFRAALNGAGKFDEVLTLFYLVNTKIELIYFVLQTITIIALPWLSRRW
ncbi:MAG: hypothetical protein OXR68_06460 [Alphaproteobacteria bacterium]|nr:hypothetical protein [Alphaproteobacteria bacterium]MDD9920246.1 hypothetical protein [Alphaproteobacteria bacterium]